MHRLRRTLACIAWLGLAGASASAQQQSGVLLTTTSASSGSQSLFHAYWITHERDQVQIAEGMRLLVLRDDGWWEVGTTTLTQMNSQVHSQEVWASPLGSPHARTRMIPLSDDDACPGDLSTYSVGWVASDFAAVHHDYESTCGGHPISGEESFTVRLDDLRGSHLGSRLNLKHLKLSDVAGAEAVKAMALGAEVANARAAQSVPEEKNNPPITTSDTAWIVIRRKGHYRLLGTTPIERGQGGNTYDIPIDPPKSLAGADELAVGWDAILDQVPDAQDAYSSPDGDFLVVLAPHYLSIFDLQQRTIGRRRMRMMIESPNVIAAQWATGINVQRWSETLLPLLKEAPYLPEK
jgi:hypothetical protein